MFHVALYEPCMPANTGNIGRVCVGLGCTLHIVGKPAFHLDDKHVRRAGLDYWPLLTLQQHESMHTFERDVPGRLWVYSTTATTLYTTPNYQEGDVFLFGSESHGLPAEVRERHASRLLRIPLPTGLVRSLNLANSVSIVAYEALRQIQARQG